MSDKIDELIDRLILDLEMGNDGSHDDDGGWPRSRADLDEAIEALRARTEKAEAALIKLYNEPVMSCDDLRELSNFAYSLKEGKKMSEKLKLWDFLPAFVEALTEQLKSDEARWGDTWLKRTRKGQDERTVKSLRDKFDQFENAGTPINWLKVAGEALICWIRENHPEIWPL